MCRRETDRGRRARKDQKHGAVPRNAAPDRAFVARAIRFLQQPGRDDECRPEKKEQPPSGRGPGAEPEIRPRASRRGQGVQPPACPTEYGTATAKPARITTSCTRFTHAELSSPPAMK